VYFARPGTIAEIRVDEEREPAPVLTQILLKPGERVEAEAREVFLGQILWSFPAAELPRLLPELLASSAETITVGYEAD
jgi:hypothetical protein